MKKIPLLDLDPRYFRYLLPYRAHLALGFLTMVAVAALDIAMPWPLKFIVDNVIGGRPYSDPFSRALAEFFGDDPRWLAAFFGLAIILFTALNGALSFIFESLQGMIQSLTTFRLRSDAFAHLSNLSLQFHDHARAGEIVSRVNGDAGRVMEAFVASTGETIVNALKFAGIAGVMLFVNWRFSVIALAYAPLLLFLFGAFRRNIKSSAKDAREQEGQMLAVTHETVSAIRVVQAFGREEDEQRRFDEYGAARARAEIRAKRWEALFEPIVDVIKAAGTAAVIWYGVAQILSDQLTVGELLIFLSYLSTFYSPLKKFSKLAASLQKASVSGERLAELLDTDQVIRDAPNARALTRARGQIDFAQVSFAYDDKRPVLSDASFTALPGQMIGLVGATGAGKTTIANLLLRFYDVTAGRIALDGVDIHDLRLRDYRRQFALVPQEPILFAASIRDNIAYGAPHAQMPEIIAAARAANAHEFIMKLPNGYAAEIGERGVTLSGGQRQRLAIARAILLNAPILILDEPTAALDAASEREVMQALERLMRGRTTFVIAHRLSTIRQADLILVLEDGRIVERGGHTELVQRGGRYAELVRMQSGATPARTLELAR
ncbi:Putative multidrug export ATP-binding/permease protein [Anaerolineae bacterium]|nr:Putative multidrug export ATP-binding/permease protein [Anaerolineae bacterium]